MKKFAKDLLIKAVEQLENNYVVIKVTDEEEALPEMMPGQFVEILCTDSPKTFLRRPISINYIDRADNTLWLLIHAVGEGTRSLCRLKAGTTLNCVYPLGNSFSLFPEISQRVLLVGGGVGTAPLLYYGQKLLDAGSEPVFLLGGKSRKDLLQIPMFQKIGKVCATTEDGSCDTKGFVIHHPIMEERFDRIASCGPLPMMKAVAQKAALKGIPCEVSLENLMACGLGACLCCVEKTVDGNLCVCKEGPVFDTKQLLWDKPVVRSN